MYNAKSCAMIFYLPIIFIMTFFISYLDYLFSNPKNSFRPFFSFRSSGVKP